MTKYMAKLPNPRLFVDPDRAERQVFVLSELYDALNGPWHAHGRAQLIHASTGVLTVEIRSGLWVVPPNRAVWILPNTEHRVSSRKAFWLRTLYAAEGSTDFPQSCCVVAVDSLVSELFIAASEFGSNFQIGGAEDRLIRVILDRLPQLAIAPLHLPAIKDRRLARIGAEIMNDLTVERTLSAYASAAGLAVRTAARLFVKDTGLTFGQWRHQLRMLRALELLGNGSSVTDVAFDVGYRDTSAFIAIFRRTFGKTPGQYS